MKNLPPSFQRIFLSVRNIWRGRRVVLSCNFPSLIKGCCSSNGSDPRYKKGLIDYAWAYTWEGVVIAFTMAVLSKLVSNPKACIAATTCVVGTLVYLSTRRSTSRAR